MKSFFLHHSEGTNVQKFKKFELKSKIIMYDSSQEEKPKEVKKQNIAVRFQEVVLGGLEQLFYKYGKFVAR